jgi:tetratricopeptide (TPR) repeat protein
MSRLPEQIKTALGMALLRIPLLPAQVNPGKDALIHAAGEAQALISDGQFDQAARALQQLVTDYPGTPWLHCAYGVTLASLKKYDQAETEFREEIRILPSSRAAHQALAEALQQLNRKPEGARELETAKKLATNAPPVDPATAKYYERNSDASGSTSTQNANHTAGASSDNTQDSGFDRLVGEANAARDSGHTDTAIAAYQRALHLRSDWEEGWRSLGTLFFMSRRYPEAASAFKNAVALDPKHGEAWAMLGLAEFQDKDYKNSLIHLRRGDQVGLAGNAAARKFAKYHLALLLNLNGDFDEATDALIPEVGPSPLEPQIKIALGIALLRLPLLPDQIEPSKTALVAVAGDAAALLAASKYDQAFVILKQMCHDHPDTPYLHYAYGNALAFTSQYDDAEAQLRQEIRLNPGSSLAYLRLATISLQMHKPEDALQSAEHAVQIAPNLAEAHYLLGRARLDLGHTAEAIDELEVARKLAPNSPEVHFTLARAYAKAKRTDDADHERAAFERLNTLAQEQRATHGPQAYGAAHGQSGLTPVGKATETNSSPQ